MHKLWLVVLACAIRAGHGRRVRESTSYAEKTSEAHAGTDELNDRSRALSMLLLASNPEAAFNLPGQGPRVPSSKQTLASSRPAVLDPLKKELDQLTRSVSAGALAASVALMSRVDFALAEEALSPFQKVDKTGPIGFIASLIEDGIDLAHSGLNNAGLEYTYGISICLFTLLIRMLTLPLTITQLTSAAKMQQMAPLQKKINDAYPKPADQDKKNQMLAQLYQSANVNPLAGCLPALVQIPVFISLYRALTNLEAEQKLAEPFLWIPNLEGPVYGAGPGTSLQWFTSIISGAPKLGWEETQAFLTIPVILIISQTISTRLLNPPKDPKTLSEQELSTQQIVQFIPLVIAFFSLNVPAGLSLYWIVSNILQSTFTLLVKQNIKNDGLPPEAEKLMERLESSPTANSGAPRYDPSKAGAAKETRRTRKKKISYIIETDKPPAGASAGRDLPTSTAVEVQAEAVPMEDSSGGGGMQPASAGKTSKKKRRKKSKKNKQ